MTGSMRRLSIGGAPRHNDRRLCGLAARSAMAMTGSSEFTTWAALAGAAIAAGLSAIYSSSLWVLIPAALVGAYLGYKGEQAGRRYIERALARNRSR